MNQPWLQNDTSFLQGVDAGNRLFESIADVQAKQLATEAAKQELPLRLIQLQTQNQQALQSLQIQRQMAPVQLNNAILAGQEQKVQIDNQQLEQQVKRASLEDSATLAQVQAAYAQTGEIPDAVYKTPQGNAAAQAWLSTNAVHQQVAADTADFNARLAKLPADIRAEVIGLPFGPHNTFTADQIRVITDGENMKEAEDMSNKLSLFKQEQDITEANRLKSITAKNEATLKAVEIRSNSQGRNITDPLLRQAFVGERNALLKRTDLSPDLIGEKIEELYKKYTTPGGLSSAGQTGEDASYLSEIDAELSKARTARLQNIASGKSTSKIDDQIKNLTAERNSVLKRSQAGPPAPSAASGGTYDPKTKTFIGPDGKPLPKAAAPQAASGSPQASTGGAVQQAANTATDTGAAGFNSLVDHLDDLYKSNPSKYSQYARVRDTAQSAFWDELAKFSDAQPESIGSSVFKRSGASALKNDPAKADRIIKAFPDDVRKEFWDSVYQRIRNDRPNILPSWLR